MCTKKGKKWTDFSTDVNEQSSISTSDQRSTISIMQKSLICHAETEFGFLLVYSA